MKHLLSIKQLRATRSQDFSLAIDDLRLPSGTIMCVAGPNGSGKTTLIECLVGLAQPQMGAVFVSGHRVDQHLRTTKRLVGFIPDDDSWFVKELCAREYFDLLKTIYQEVGCDPAVMEARISRLAHCLMFTAFDQPLEQLSHGNKKKVQLIAGLMHTPKVIVVDELRNGLDPLAIIAAENIIKQEAERGVCVIAATHDLWWAERMAHRVLVLLEGRVAAYDKTAMLVATHGSLEKLLIRFASEARIRHATV